MIYHYMTRYIDGKNNEIYCSWLQFFGITFSKRYYMNGHRVTEDELDV